MGGRKGRQKERTRNGGTKWGKGGRKIRERERKGREWERGKKGRKMSPSQNFFNRAPHIIKTHFLKNEDVYSLCENIFQSQEILI